MMMVMGTVMVQLIREAQNLHLARLGYRKLGVISSPRCYQTAILRLLVP